MKRPKIFQWMILCGTVYLCLGNDLWAKEVPSPVPIMNVEAFRRAMAQRHELKAKKDPRFKQEMKYLEVLMD
jgi:hypothetical protein